LKVKVRYQNVKTFSIANYTTRELASGYRAIYCISYTWQTERISYVKIKLFVVSFLGPFMLTLDTQDFRMVL